VIRAVSTFVLVHPAWFGGWSWARLVPALRAAGHDVHCPTLTGLGERAHLARPDVGLGTHIDDVGNLVCFEDLHDVTLVGSSSAGMVIAAVADQLPDRISQVVYLDAFVPTDGQSPWDLIPPDRRLAREQMVASEGDGWSPPRFAPEPWEQFVPAAWGITDAATLQWTLARLRPTPIRHFTDPVGLDLAEDRQPRRGVRPLPMAQPGVRPLLRDL
jgi:pimeloyl-ACP methyl ester carboxylesterase